MVNSDGIIRFITKPMANILGYTIQEMVGQNVLDQLITKSERKNSQKILNKANQINYGEFIDFDFKLLTKQGDSYDLKVKLVRLKNDFLDSYNIALISDNIVYGKVIEKALIESQGKLDELYELADELILFLDSSRSIIYSNKTFNSKFGHPKLNQPFNDFFEKSAANELDQYLNKLTSGTRTEHITLTLKSDLDRKTYHLRGYAILDEKNGKSGLYQCVFVNITDEVRAEKVKNLYYNVSSQIVENADLPSVYKNIHNELKEVIECSNLYIALYNPDETGEVISFPYFIDEGGIDKSKIERPLTNGITEYAINIGKPVSLRKDEIEELKSSGIISVLGKLPEHWLGVPLSISGRVMGILAVQSYSVNNKYTDKDLELLDFASSQIALAIQMATTREELQNQTARLNAIFESSSHLIWSVNKDLEVTSFNKNYFEANFINYDANPQIIEGSKNEPKSFKNFWLDKYKRAFKGEKFQFEIKLKDEQNNEIWKEIYLNPIYTGINKIEEVSGIAHDVTQKKRSEIALLKSEEKFRNIFESFQDLYFRCNLKGDIIMVSPSVQELTGYKAHEVLGKHIDDYYLYNPRVKKILQELRQEKNLKNVEVSIVKRDGEVRQCICNVRIIQNNKNEPFEIEGVVRDITQLKLTNQQLIEANEMAENSLRVKEQFLANMSHEIRTPMNGIIGMIDLLAQSELDNSQKGYIDTLNKSSSILMDILNDILDLSKIEAGRMELKPVTFSLAHLVDKIHALFIPIASTNRVNLHYHINNSLPTHISTDETRLMQVLSNLVSNALKFTKKEGSIDIGFELIEKQKNKAIIRVDVRDSGIGISKENQKKLFSNFTQLDNSTTKPYSGTGLGLAISKQLVTLLGGQIGVHSNPGLGSTFWFTFLADIVQAKEVQEKEIENEADAKTLKTVQKDILIVDDNLINREVAKEILSKAGCSVDIAISGMEAIEKVTIRHYDIVFMDIQMPEMDGIETTKRIRELNLKSPPKIIAMTAYAMKEDKEKFIELGMDDYLPKPIRANKLIEKVGEFDTPESNSESLNSIQTNYIINNKVIAQLKKYVGSEMIDSVYGEFEIETKEQLKECKTAISQSRWEDIQKLLHTIKGTSGTLGIEKLSNKAREIELRLKQNNNEGFEKDFSDLINNFVEFQDNFRGILRNN